MIALGIPFLLIAFVLLPGDALTTAAREQVRRGELPRGSRNTEVPLVQSGDKASEDALRYNCWRPVWNVWDKQIAL